MIKAETHYAVPKQDWPTIESAVHDAASNQQMGLRFYSSEPNKDKAFSLLQNYESGTSYTDVDRRQAEHQNNFESDVEQTTNYKIGKFIAGITIFGR